MKRLWILALLVSGLMASGQGFNDPSFSYFDTNADGKITKAEHEDGRQKRHKKMADEGRMLRNAADAPTFEEIDANGDGFITQEEFTAHQKAMRAK
jgi:Ca2+-binding EF-hand superfamily protein